ncbi:DUF2306 domain-containing protein [Paenibacillus glucanolyticus]|uniref:DUF2306 domain-containing protein n=1 Tax=Paenibacillus glucanolyticus TaxID=59843 RepID=UPI0009700223|nr:DUF2306 domain-containing protein [Paenibacillus glucanolyticus]MPY17672.1 DUF2306 domain-containing protein [Paenibacillus glucanolyticus]OMF78704.1 hypothetical protein BK142_10515 [Paenibacillus glucanolyticus]
MKKRKTLYRLLACVSIIFIFYALVKNYWIDPGATGFLSRKTGLKRELNLPVWLNVMYVHVAFACLAMASGLVNFSNRIFKKSRRFHRINGYIYIVSVLLVVLTSGYMAPYATNGKISSWGFNALNMLWLFITITALIQIKKKRIIRHRNWMIRSYAFCFTNMFIHLITSLFHQGLGLEYAASYTISIYASIALLLVIPEIIIRTSRTELTIR